MREPTAEQRRLFDAITDLARPVILTQYTADSCIASTRLGLDVLAYFGVPATEMPLHVGVYNAEAVALLEGGMTFPELAEELQRHSVEEDGGPWSVGIGPGGGGYAGHLVITVPSLGVVIDLSADQFTREHKNIHLKPYWARVDDEEWWTDDEAFYPLLADDGSMIMLDRRAHDKTGYLRTPNWKRRSASSGPGEFKRLTGEVIRQVRSRLAEQG